MISIGCLQKSAYWASKGYQVYQADIIYHNLLFYFIIKSNVTDGPPVIMIRT